MQQSKSKFSLLRLAAVFLVAGCTVVPDPTSGGVNPVAGNSGQTIFGNWQTQSVTTTSRSMSRLSLSKGFWYQRWTIDSIFGAAALQTTLLEQGSWSWMGDSSLILVPTFRQVGASVSPNLPDTIDWSWASDSLLRWVSKRNSRDTIYWHPG